MNVTRQSIEKITTIFDSRQDIYKTEPLSTIILISQLMKSDNSTFEKDLLLSFASRKFEARNILIDKEATKLFFRISI